MDGIFGTFCFKKLYGLQMIGAVFFFNCLEAGVKLNGTHFHGDQT